MILRAAALSDVGRRRRTNEDRYGLAPELGLFLVADGMGGHTAGQVASGLASDGVLEAVREGGPDASLTERLRRAVASANERIFSTAEAKPELSGMGTTLVALLVAGGRAAIAHVGDSRGYRVRAGRIRQLTDDHSVVGELQRRGEISADAAREHPHRHVLTRALGVRSEAEPDLGEITLEHGDVFVLCTDGLTHHVRDEEIAKAAAGEGDLEAACRGLVFLANARGGEDNVTVLLVRCDKD
jgi:serine/threonine protein phosphatase PrpC